MDVLCDQGEGRMMDERKGGGEWVRRKGGKDGRIGRWTKEERSGGGGVQKREGVKGVGWGWTKGKECRSRIDKGRKRAAHSSHSH